MLAMSMCAGRVSADAVDIRVSASPDDAEESSNGAVAKASSDLELVFDSGGNQTVGIRFRAVAIPQGAAITDAYIQFKVDEASSQATALSIAGEASDNAAKFGSSSFNISSRPRTAANVAWLPAPWPTVGAAGPEQRTPNLAPVIQEIVSRPGWSSGNSLAIIITGSGERVAESYNGDRAGAPLLHVEFGGAPQIQPPTVDPLTTDDPTPTITGGWDEITANSLTVTVNAVLYTLGDGNLSSTGGSWSLTIPAGDALSDGTYDVTATVTDGSGNSVDDPTSGELVIDTGAPQIQPPTVDPLTTSDSTPTITGTWDQTPGNNLTVTVNAVLYALGDGNLSSAGVNWSLTIPAGDALSDGTYDVRATVSDASGNSVDDLTSGELIIDTGIGGSTPIEHVIVVVGENRTFDNVFGVYSPGPGQSIDNLLSRGIVNPDGSPGPNFSDAAQNQAVSRGTYSIDPPRIGVYPTLPRPSTTDAKRQTNFVPDLRFPDDLPNGPFQITDYVDYADFAGDPVHRFFQMWQQVDTGALDLLVWVSETAGEGPDSPSTPGGSCGDGPFSSEGMGFYNMTTGDAPYFKSLAQQYAISDNFHQGIMGGTGANYFYIATGDVAFYNEDGALAAPPANQIENPDPQPGTDNCYTRDGYEGGSYVNCADPGQPGVAAIRDYLDTLPYPSFRDGRCEANTYYLVNNYEPGYFPSGAPRPLGPDKYTAPPQTVPTIAEALASGGVSWKWYTGGRLGGGGYCAVCDALTFSREVMTTSLKDNLHGLNQFWDDVADAATMPAVSFIAPNTGKSGHPGNSTLAKFESFVKGVVDAVKANPELWASTAIFITMDEGGGYYDSGYIQPIDFFGDGPRIPLIVVSPYARAGHVDHTYSNQASILKFIEANWGLAPLSARSHDNLPNPVTQGDPYVPVNSPAVGDLMTLFDFSN